MKISKQWTQTYILHNIVNWDITATITAFYFLLCDMLWLEFQNKAFLEF